MRKRIDITLPEETLELIDRVTEHGDHSRFIVAFDPTLGAEIQKTRPALIVQNDIANRHSSITIVAALTSQFDEPLYPTEVLIQSPEGGLSLPSVVLLNQIRSIAARGSKAHQARAINRSRRRWDQ